LIGLLANWADEQLLAQLRAGLARVDGVPPEVTDFAKAAFSWLGAEEELNGIGRSDDD
jgi:hypothetical protein